MSDALHEVGLAQPDPAVEEQGVEGDRAALGHAPRGGMGQFVRFPNDEALERITKIREESDDPELKKLLEIEWGQDFGRTLKIR